MTGRVVLLATSPRLPLGLLTAEAWDLVRSATCSAADGPANAPLVEAIRAAGGQVELVGVDESAGRIADELLARARSAGTAVWLLGPGADAGIASALQDRLAGEPEPAVELEVLVASWDPPGARLLDVVAVMDRLRSPGGCPWDAEQTHSSLMPYLLEETYEAYDALVEEDLDALREELGDVLLQVAFHARLAEERPDGERWSIDDVGGDLVEKLVRRHPHVFAEGAQPLEAAEVHAQWEEIKKSEKQRSSATDGVARSQPALALAAKYVSRARRAGIALEPLEVAGDPAAELGAALFRLVVDAVEHQLDPEAALRAAALEYAEAVRQAEGVRQRERAAAPGEGPGYAS
jgi:XTP/dITP diphosphohydrolase